jgi:RNA polymerase sigma-70 factor (ECF subfamily)
LPIESINIIDSVLLSQLQNEDRKAFESIYRKYWLKCYNTAYKRLKNKEIAEDIVQNIFTRLWINRSNQSIENLESYLLTAVRYGVLDQVSRGIAYEPFFDKLETALIEKQLPSDQFAAKELMKLIYAYAETLPSKRKEVFHLYLKDKFSTQEIADVLKISQKTVQNQIRNALIGLRLRISSLFL